MSKKTLWLLPLIGILGFGGIALAEDCDHYVVADSNCAGGLHAWSVCESVNVESGYLEITIYDDGCPYVVNA